MHVAGNLFTSRHMTFQCSSWRPGFHGFSFT
jgi:hypothetical protein